MRFRFLFVVVALAAAKGAASAAVIQDKADVSSFNTLAGGTQMQRSLRGFLDENEERGGGGTMLDDILIGFVQKARANLPQGFTAAALAEWKAVTSHVDDVMQYYPKTLSEEAMKELRAAETKRIHDWALYGKADKHNLLRPMKGVAESDTAPTLTSLVGRDNQVLGEAGGRSVVCNVVMRSKKEGGGILLISSSKLEKQDFILPKGGLEEGESYLGAAFREVLEEGGVGVRHVKNLGNTQVEDKTYESFLMESDKVYKQWSESRRLRVWLSWKDAIELLEANKHNGMAQIVEQAREAAEVAAKAA